VKADVEIGGTDQKFNLLVGRELQRDFGQDPQAVMTLPLLAGTDGAKKMSKSYGNYVALNDAPQEMFGKIMSVPDETMIAYYELLTQENLPEIKAMHPKSAKMRLAFLMVERYHSTETAQKAQQEFEQVFSKNSMPEEIEEYKVSKNKILLSHLLFESGLSPSKKESKRLIENNGVRMDGKPVAADMELEITGSFILQVGKRKFKRIRPI
jgi:tyrosyl-tRNA synthetase